MAAHRLAANYRNRGLYVTSGILFNHESPRRGPEMVTRKITRTAARWAMGDRTKLMLGNLHSRRDCGFAGDYVKAMHAMLQNGSAKDYVIGTGTSHSVEEFLRQVLVELHRATGGAEVPSVEDWVEINSHLLRTGEIHDLQADATLAREDLGWQPSVDFHQLVRMMVEADIASAREANRAPDKG